MGSGIMHLSRFAKFFLSAGILAFSAAGLSGHAAAQCEFPCKPVIFVAPGSLGGGSDTQARLAENIVNKSGIFGDEPVAVVNRGGGGSQEAFTFMLSHSGDPHYLLTFQASLITYTLLGEAQYELQDFTPIANVAQDPTMIVARPDTGWKTLGDLIDAAKAKPGEIVMGGDLARRCRRASLFIFHFALLIFHFPSAVAPRRRTSTAR